MISRFIVLFLIINIAFCDFTCNSPTSFNPAQTTVVPSSNGYRVTLNSNGWVYCDPLYVNPLGPTETWATLLRSTGETGVGLNGATCGTPLSATVAPGLSGAFTGQAANSCPADFATVYTATPAASTTSPLLTASTLTIGVPVGFDIIQPEAKTINNVNTVDGIIVTNQVTVPPTPVVVTNAGSAVDGNGAATQYAISDLSYTLYVQTTGTATVCFQNQYQFNSNPGECGEQLFVVGHTINHASVLSTSACIFVALIAFIFYN